MYHHVKKLMFTVRVDQPDVRFGNMLLEQFGGANGELAAAMQYSIQGLNCEDPDRKDLLIIGTEELSHLEVVGCLARMHLKPRKKSGFGDLNQHDPDSIRFYTKTKTITSRWPSGVKEGAEFSIPTMN